ncbi:MAG TPA: ATP-binding protein [Solirubrobacterales bacterium]|jgi:PAS domain S-box-containing protein|nr:ATP-binding protein [Solirubrobacterales bacterium]
MGPDPQSLHIALLVPADALVIWASLRARRRSAEVPWLRAFWTLIAAAWIAELLADLSLATYDILLDDPTFPSVADFFFLLFYPLTLLALLRIPIVRGTRSQRLRTFLDCATILAGAVAAIWYFALGPIAMEGGMDYLATAVSAAYPIADILLFGVLSLVLMRPRPDVVRTPLFCVAIGLGLLIVADTIYSSGLLRGTYAPGDPVDTLYVLLAAPFVLAAASQRPVGRDDPGTRVHGYGEPSPRAGWLPLAGMLLGFGILLGTQWQDRFFPDLSLLLLAGLLGGLAALRQHVAQVELRQLQQRFRAIFDNAGVGIAFSAFAGGIPRIVEVNAAFSQMLGYTAEELRDDDFSLITHPDDLGDLAEIGRMVRDGEDTITREQRHRCKDGTFIWVSLTISILRSDAGEPSFAIGMLEDITRRKEAERVKEEFVSVVGHELRTPLTSIRGSLGLLEGGVVGEIPPEAAQMLATAVSNTDRLVRLINDILDIERIASDRDEIQVGSVLATDLVRYSLEAVAAMAAEGGIELETEVEEVAVAADSDRIVQTLVNLIGNGIKFSAPGSEVMVRVARDGESARFSVSDRGRGIPASQLEAVFERFKQVDASDAREKSGTGLGLAIARSIVKRHGGRIWAESEEGVGATFIFTLPLASRDRAPELVA